MRSARDLGSREEVIMEEDEEDQDIQPGNTELDEDYDSDVVPAEKSFFYHEDEHGADLEEDRSLHSKLPQIRAKIEDKKST